MNKCKITWITECLVMISGIIDEYSDFSQLFAGKPSDIWVDFNDIERINSSGVREWIQAVMSTKSNLHLINCSSVIVDQFAMIPEFIGKNGVVESFFVHYVCDSCNIEEKRLLEAVKDIHADSDLNQFLEKGCNACGSTMELDHNLEVYFSFIKFLPKAS